MADKPIEIAYDLAANTGIVVVRFTLDDQLQKEGLTEGVIVHHILTQQVASICMTAAERALNDPDGSRLAEEEAKALAEHEAAFAKKRNAIGSVSKMDAVVTTIGKELAATRLAAQAADEEVNRELKVAAEAKRLADEATAKAIAELTTPMEVVP